MDWHTTSQFSGWHRKYQVHRRTRKGPTDALLWYPHREENRWPPQVIGLQEEHTYRSVLAFQLSPPSTAQAKVSSGRYWTLDRSTNIVTEAENRKEEDEHIQTALSRCGYPDWSIKKVKLQMSTKKQNRTLGIQPISTRTKSRQQWSYRTYMAYQNQSPVFTNAKAYLHPWDLSSQLEVCWYIQRINPDHKTSVNVSTEYHAGIVIGPTLGKPVWGYTSTDKKFHNATHEPTHAKHQQISSNQTEQVSRHRPCHLS